MPSNNKLRRRPVKKEFICLHCGKSFYEHHLLSIDYCSKECREHYHPKSESKKLMPVAFRKFYRTYRQAIILQLRDAQGAHGYDKQQGNVTQMTKTEGAKIKAELKESYLRTNQELNRDVSHLSKEQIDKNVDELFEMLQSILI